MVFVVFLLDFGSVPTVWYFLLFYWSLELFLQCDICCFSITVWSCSYSVIFVVFQLEFGAALTVWYFFFFFLEFGAVPTVWYLLFFY